MLHFELMLALHFVSSHVSVILPPGNTVPLFDKFVS